MSRALCASTSARQLQLKAVREADGGVTWCEDEQTSYFALYERDDDQVGTWAWIADFQHKSDALRSLAALGGL